MKQREERMINGLRFVLTCGACPEQYDVFMDGKRVAYVRLRHGNFSVQMPDVGENQIYSVDGVTSDGVFINHERGFYLKAAAAVIRVELYRNGYVKWLTNRL